MGARVERSSVGAALDAVGESLAEVRALPRSAWVEYAGSWPETAVPRIVWEPLSLSYAAEAQQGGDEGEGLAISGYALRVACHIWAESLDATVILFHALLRAFRAALQGSWRLVSGEWSEAAAEQDRAAYGRALVAQVEILVPVPRTGDAMVEVEATDHACTIDVPGGSGPEGGC